MKTLDLNTLEDFQARLGMTFAVGDADDSPILTLSEAKSVGTGQREGGAFSVVFESHEDLGLEQQIHALTASDGTVEIFLVPIGPFGKGFGYEAVFT